MKTTLIWLFLLISNRSGLGATDALVAKVGREPVLQSDLQRFHDVEEVLACAGLTRRQTPLPLKPRELLELYIEEEMVYLDARAKKFSVVGLIPEAMKQVHSKPVCKDLWLGKGRQYSKSYFTEKRPREGESLLVREIEKRVLVEKFRKSESVSDGELWRREAKARYQVKVYLE